MHIALRNDLPRCTTIVIKIGSRIIASPDMKKRVSQLANAVSRLQSSGIRLIVVSSGAIAHGMQALGMKTRPTSIPKQQACASIGQYRLMRLYETYFSKNNITIGQVLLTWDDLRSKKRYLNLRNTLFQLLDSSVIPIVNENDSVGVEEIQFGNNDMLGAQVALLAHADLFVNLTDVAGLYDRNPHNDWSARQIPVVKTISSRLKNLADDRKKELSIGGMRTKIKAAEIVTKAGIFALIGDGLNSSLNDVLSKKNRGTLFTPEQRKMSSRRRWIAFTGQCKGTLSIDAGAVSALVQSGKSLLPAGITDVQGSFKAGDKVEIITRRGKTIARGLVNYSSDEIRQIKKLKTSAIAGRLGTKRFDEAIHRDNLVVL